MKITAPRIQETLRSLSYLDGDRHNTIHHEGPATYIEGVAFGLMDLTVASLYAVSGGFVAVAMTMAIAALLRAAVIPDPAITLTAASLSVAVLGLSSAFLARRRLWRWFKGSGRDPLRSARRKTVLDTTIQLLSRLRAHFGDDLHATVWPQWGEDEDVIKVRLLAQGVAQDLIVSGSAERLSIAVAPVTSVPPLFPTPEHVKPPKIELEASHEDGQAGWRHPQHHTLLRDAPVWLADATMRSLLERTASSPLDAQKTASPAVSAATASTGLRWVTGAPAAVQPSGALLDAELSAPGAAAITTSSEPMPTSIKPRWLRAGFLSTTLPALVCLLCWFGLSITMTGSSSPGGALLSMMLSLISLLAWARAHTQGWPRTLSLRHTPRRASAATPQVTLRDATLTLIGDPAVGQATRSMDLERPFTMNFYRAASTLQAHLIVELVPASGHGDMSERLRFGVPVSPQHSEDAALAALPTLDIEVGLFDEATFLESLWPELTAYAALHDRRPRWTFMPATRQTSATETDADTQEATRFAPAHVTHNA